MRTIHDLRLPSDRQLLGHALEALIPEMIGEQPIGRTWDALGEVCDDLVRRALERFRSAPRGSLVARALASLGLREKPAPDLSDLARLEGYQDALVDVRAAILVLVREARAGVEAAAREASAKGARDGRAEPRFRPGASGA